MFAKRARVRPCSALLCFSSSGRVTSRLPSSCFRLIVGCTSSSSLPLGPSTETWWSLIVTLALPTGTGFFPIRLMTTSWVGGGGWWVGTVADRPPTTHDRLHNRTQHFAADVVLAGLAVAHHALARGDDGDAHPVQHARQVADAAVHAAAGLAGAVDRVDHLVAGHRVLELDADLPLPGVVDHVDLFDVPFVLQHLGDAGADLALGDHDQPPTDSVGVPDPREHVRDGVLVIHRSVPLRQPYCVPRSNRRRTRWALVREPLPAR